MSTVEEKEELKKENRTWGFFIEGFSAIWSLLGDYKKQTMIATTLVFFTSGWALMNAYMLKLVFDALPGLAKSGITNEFIITFLGWVFAYLAFTIILFKVREPIWIRIIIALEKKWPIEAQEKLLALSQGYHTRENTGKTPEKKSAKFPRVPTKQFTPCLRHSLASYRNCFTS